MSDDDKVTIKQEPTELEEIKQLLKESLDYNKAAYALMEKTNKFIFWQRIFSVIKVLLIAVPIILGIIYLPPLIQNILGPYKALLDIK